MLFCRLFEKNRTQSLTYPPNQCTIFPRTSGSFVGSPREPCVEHCGQAISCFLPHILNMGVGAVAIMHRFLLFFSPYLASPPPNNHSLVHYVGIPDSVFCLPAVPTIYSVISGCRPVSLRRPRFSLSVLNESTHRLTRRTFIAPNFVDLLLGGGWASVASPLHTPLFKMFIGKAISLSRADFFPRASR